MEARESLIALERAKTEEVRLSNALLAIQGESSLLDLAAKKLVYAKETATDWNGRVYTLGDVIGSNLARHCIETLGIWSRLDPKCGIEIILNSPGGDALPGLALFDFIGELRRRGHSITTHVLGCAASLAGVLLQAGERRVMGQGAFLLIHEISAQMGGKIGDIDDTSIFLKKLQTRMVDIYMERVQGKISRAAFIHGCKRKDWWLSAEECLKLGFIDEVW